MTHNFTSRDFDTFRRSRPVLISSTHDRWLKLVRESKSLIALRFGDHLNKKNAWNSMTIRLWLSIKMSTGNWAVQYSPTFPPFQQSIFPFSITGNCVKSQLFGLQEGHFSRVSRIQTEINQEFQVKSKATFDRKTLAVRQTIEEVPLQCPIRQCIRLSPLQIFHIRHSMPQYTSNRFSKVRH